MSYTKKITHDGLKVVHTKKQAQRAKDAYIKAWLKANKKAQNDAVNRIHKFNTDPANKRKKKLEAPIIPR